MAGDECAVVVLPVNVRIGINEKPRPQPSAVKAGDVQRRVAIFVPIGNKPGIGLKKCPDLDGIPFVSRIRERVRR